MKLRSPMGVVLSVALLMAVQPSAFAMGKKRQTTPGNCQIAYAIPGDQVPQVIGTNFGNGAISLKDCMKAVEQDFLQQSQELGLGLAEIAFSNTQIELVLSLKRETAGPGICQVAFSAPGMSYVSSTNPKKRLKDCLAYIERDFAEVATAGPLNQAVVDFVGADVAAKGRISLKK